MAKRPGRRAQLRAKSREQLLVLTLGDLHEDCPICRQLNGTAGRSAGAEREHRTAPPSTTVAGDTRRGA